MHLKRPAQARNIFQSAHLLYRIWAQQGIKDWAVFPVEVIETSFRYCSSSVFARRHAAREAFSNFEVWINMLRTLNPRGFSVRNDRPAKRSLNYFEHRLQCQRRQASSATTTLITAAPTTTTTTVPVAPPSDVASSLAVHGSNAMPCDLRHQSYARTAHI